MSIALRNISLPSDFFHSLLSSKNPACISHNFSWILSWPNQRIMELDVMCFCPPFPPLFTSRYSKYPLFTLRVRMWDPVLQWRWLLRLRETSSFAPLKIALNLIVLYISNFTLFRKKTDANTSKHFQELTSS